LYHCDMNQPSKLGGMGDPQLTDVYNKMEKLEHTARVVLAAAAPETAATFAWGGGG
jgi:hypothetical protein